VIIQIEGGLISSYLSPDRRARV